MSGVVAILAGGGSSSATTGIILNNGTANSSGAGARTSTFRINSDGFVYKGDNAVYTSQYEWKQNANPASAYEVYCTSTYSLVSGTTGAWLVLSTTRDWSITDATNDGEGVVDIIALQIRNASTLEVLATASVTVYANRTG